MSTQGGGVRARRPGESRMRRSGRPRRPQRTCSRSSGGNRTGTVAVSRRRPGPCGSWFSGGCVELVFLIGGHRLIHLSLGYRSARCFEAGGSRWVGTVLGCLRERGLGAPSGPCAVDFGDHQPVSGWFLRVEHRLGSPNFADVLDAQACVLEQVGGLSLSLLSPLRSNTSRRVSTSTLRCRRCLLRIYRVGLASMLTQSACARQLCCGLCLLRRGACPGPPSGTLGSAAPHVRSSPRFRSRISSLPAGGVCVHGLATAARAAEPT